MLKLDRHDEDLKLENNGNILYDSNLYFHSIGFDLNKIQSIFENGILSKKRSIKEKVDIAQNYTGYNQSDYISLVESPIINDTFNFGAFGTYIKGSISFVLKDIPTQKAKQGTDMYSGFIDEVFTYDIVSPENIKGIMIPEDMLYQPINQIPLKMGEIGSAHVKSKCLNILNYYKGKTSKPINTDSIFKNLKDLEILQTYNKQDLNQLSKIDSLIQEIEYMMKQYIYAAYQDIYNSKSPMLIDVLKKSIPNGIQVYNSKGNKLALNSPDVCHNKTNKSIRTCINIKKNPK